MKNIRTYIVFFILCAIFLGTLQAHATTTTPLKDSMEVAAWIPWWRKSQGVADTMAHTTAFTEISPFGYTVRSDGTLVDTMKIGEAPWPDLIRTAKASGVRVVPSITWSDPIAIDRVLKTPFKRQRHVQQIVSLVYQNNWDGIDIDYEAKKAESKKYFSYFLRDLDKAIGNKIIACSIEPRTPLEARFDTPRTGIEYSNDFKEIGKYCDRVRIMTYDQGRIDLQLNRLSTTTPYAPVSDPLWAEKVMRLAMQEIPKEKLLVGIPTYGYAYNLTVRPHGGYHYDLLRSFNAPYALDIATQLGITPVRNRAGEMSFMYRPASAVSALAATTTDLVSSSTAPTIFRYLSWSDAGAIQNKIELAKRLGVRGVALFKIDGEQDSGLWSLLGK